jgi:hypothetical protein
VAPHPVIPHALLHNRLFWTLNAAGTLMSVVLFGEIRRYGTAAVGAASTMLVGGAAPYWLLAITLAFATWASASQAPQ